MSAAEKTLSWILKGGLFLTPFLVFVVVRQLYFPFITGKNFAFRILIELLAVIWVYAALRFPRFRPASSPIAWAMVAFTVVMACATIFSIDPYRSFWSNFERMEGYIAILHFLLYFLLLASVFREERDWRIFFHLSIFASIITCLYAVFQLSGTFAIHQGSTRVDATLGNATYLAAYLLFHLFFLIWFFLRTRNLTLRAVYALAFLFELVILYFTATRGAVLGLLGGVVILGAILGLAAGGRVRRWALAGIGAAIAVPIAFFPVRNMPFVQKSEVLNRFAAISLSETTTKSRFTIWSMAIRASTERPILGWGQDSFVYVFSKHYEPSLWRQEPWFDRAHNVFLDWLIAGGILGLAAYLSLFVTAFWVLVRAFRRGVIEVASFGVVAALLAAHFFQNLFVFDNLTSYLLFFAVLAYLADVSRRAAPAGATQPRQPFRAPAGLPAGVTAVAAIAFVFLFYFADWKPILAANAIIDGLITAQVHPPAGRVDETIAAFQNGLDLGTYGTLETREQISQVAPVFVRDQSLANSDKAKFLEFAIRELERERREVATDVRARAFLATLYDIGGRSADAIAVVNEALAVSPRRQQFYFVAAEAYLNAGQQAQAIEALKKAYDLDRSYPEAVVNLATVYILAERDAEAEALMEQFYGTSTPSEDRFAKAYEQRGKLGKAILIWEATIRRSVQSAEYRANLGVAYARAGRREDAIREVELAAVFDPNFKAQADRIIEAIRAGKLR